MGSAASVYIDRLLRRVRDPNSLGISRGLARQILDQSQRLTNAAFRTVKATVTLTTNPYQQFYPVTALIPDSVRVEFVREGVRDLKETSLELLAQADTKWFRRTGAKFELWAPVGRDQIVVHPAKQEASSVEVVYTKLTNVFDVLETVLAELPEDDMNHVVDLAEAMTLLVQRRYDELDPIIERYTKRLQLKEVT